MEDRRSRKTKSAINEAFLFLVESKDISRISISELCSIADISRGTFYLHYQDIYDLLESIENGVLQQIGKLFDESLLNHKPVSYQSFMEKTAEYLNDNKKIAHLFLNERTSFTFLKRVKVFFTDKEIKAHNDNTSITDIQYKVAYKATGIVGILQQWVESGMILSPKEISQIVSI